MLYRIMHLKWLSRVRVLSTGNDDDDDDNNNDDDDNDEDDDDDLL